MMAHPSSLWMKARENLSADVKEWLASLEQGIQPNATSTEQIDALIEQTTKKQKTLEKSNNKFRKYFDKITHWLDKFKGIGDVVSSFDPVHAALPWAAFRFVLQTVSAEREQTNCILELLASFPHFVFSGRVLEMVYTQESLHIGETQDNAKLSQQCLNSLQEELVKFYSGILDALRYCYWISSQHKVKRKATAIFDSSGLISVHQDLEAQHKKVIHRGEDCQKVLSQTLSRKSLDLLETIQPPLNEIRDRIRELLVRVDECKRRETLEAISPLLYRAHHDEVSRKRTGGTCEWILKKEKFIQWEESNSSVTILYGNPGAGKTFLISRVIDYTIEKAEMSEALAFFYCKRDEENRRKPRDILRSILRQLSTSMEEVEGDRIHVDLKDLPNKLALKGTTFDVSTCESVIRGLVKAYSRTTIILDALDECDRNSREELMRVLSNLTNGSPKVRVFISSRHDEDIRRYFKGIPVVEMQATDNEEDIASFVEDGLFRDSRWTDISPALQDELKSVFHKKSLGMFQWAALQVDQIRRLRLWSERNIREQLQHLPPGLKGAYDVVWNQLQEMSPYEEQLARRALQWVLCASRPLKTAELSLMMVIDPDSGMTETNTVFTPETIQSISGNLLVYDRQSNVWRFSHLSAREYIEKNHFCMLEAHRRVAISSIRFLERDLISLPPYSRKRTEHRPVINAEAFGPGGPCVEYTATCGYIVKEVFWHVHEIDCQQIRSVELATLLKSFFQPLSKGSSSFQAWRQVRVNALDWHRDSETPSDSKAPDYSFTIRISSTPLQVMSIYGVFYILRDLWEKAGEEIEVLPFRTPSPLTIAIMYRREPIWKFLLSAKAKLNSGTPRPLQASIQADYPEAFEALLDAKPNLNEIDRSCFHLSRSNSPWIPSSDTPLKAALWHSSAEKRIYFLEKLLERGADMNQTPQLPVGKEAPRPLLHEIKGAYDIVVENVTDTGLLPTLGSALGLAVQYSDESIVKFLLDRNTEKYSPDRLLQLAVRNNTTNLAPLLVRLGANVEERWEGASPLVRALCRGNLPNVLSLLDMSGMRIDLSRQEYREAVLWTLKWYDGRKVFPLLFRSKCSMADRDGELNVLDRAISLFDEYECELHEFGFPGKEFVLPFEEAAGYYQLSLFEALIKVIADPPATVEVRFGDELAEAAFLGRLHHCRVFLDHMENYADQEQQVFRNALFAGISGHLSCISWESHDNWWRPLGEAILSPKHLKVLQLLFERGLEVYTPIYRFLDALIPVLEINSEGNQVRKPCRLYQKGYYSSFSRPWFSIMWDLQNGISPQPPLGVQLRQWQFPGTLPPRCSVVTRITAVSTARPTYFVILSICGSRSNFSILSAPQRVRWPLSQRSEDGRWKRYKPEHFGVERFTNPDGEIESGNTKAPAPRGKCNTNASSCHRNMVALVLVACVVVLLSFFMDLRQFTQRT